MKNQNKVVKISKFLSLVLRHRPEKIGLELDENGWTSVADLLEKMNKKGTRIDIETLKFVVENNDKKRFAFNDNQTQIRANQGHSLKVDLGYKPQTPPAMLFHGTATRFVDSIMKSGLEKRNRHHVHLSLNFETATSVGGRHGKVIILDVLAKEMHNDGFKFFCSDNNVWLTDNVPTKYLRLSQG